MASRKDLLKAQGFTSQRLVKALVDRSPDDLDSPLKRSSLGIFASVMIAVLLVAGFGVVGWIHPGTNSSWKKDKTVVVDTTAGVVFAYLGTSLYPAYNLASAKLATGGGPTVGVKSKSLKGEERKGIIGIADAPAELPDPSLMTQYPVQLCSSTPGNSGVRTTSISLGPLAAANPSGSPAVAVADSKGTTYLLADGIAHRVPAGQPGRTLLVDLGFSTPLRPGNAFIAGLPAGSILAAPVIDGLGGPATNPVSQGIVVGTVLKQRDSTQYFAQLRDGASSITPFQARELVVLGGQKQVEVSAANIAAHRSATESLPRGDAPAERPDAGVAAALSADAPICLTWTADARAPQVSFPADAPTVPKPAGGGLADLVRQQSATGTLVQNADTADNGAVTLVTDGKLYPIAADDARSALGYAQTTPLKLPGNLIKLIPTGLAAGETLSIAAASPNKQ